MRIGPRLNKGPQVDSDAQHAAVSGGGIAEDAASPPASEQVKVRRRPCQNWPAVSGGIFETVDVVESVVVAREEV